LEGSQDTLVSIELACIIVQNLRFVHAVGSCTRSKAAAAARPSFKINGEMHQAFLLGTKLGQVLNNKPTSVVVQVTQFNKASSSYLLKDCKVGTLITVNANDVGPTDFMDRQSKLVPSRPNQPWKVLQGQELQALGFLGNSGGMGGFMGVAFFPYGLGPYNPAEIVQKYENNRPTGLFCCIKKVIFPKGKEPAEGEEPPVSLTREELQGYQYVLQPCARTMQWTPAFEVSARELHDPSKWTMMA
jgi:hypothetical protein